MRSAGLAILMCLLLAGAVRAQNVSFDDPPKVYVVKRPPTRKELEQRDSLYQYVYGLSYLKDERYAEALKSFETAARLDPDAPEYFKAQVPILAALGRYADALAATQKAVALDPGDYSSWYIQAKLLKTTVKYPEAIAALESGLKSADLKDHPEAAQALYTELGSLCESTDKFGPAADAFNKAAAILEHPDAIADKGHIPREAVLAKASEIYEKIGLLYRKAKQYDPAIDALRKAQDRSPERAGRLNFTLAHVCEEQGNLKQALVYVDAYLLTQPLSTDPHEMKISLLRRLKKTEAIVPWLEEAAGRERFNNTLQLLLAKECVSAKLPKKAEVIYKKLNEDSASADVYRGLFNIYKDEGAEGMTRILTMLDKVMDKTAREDGPAPISTTQHARAMVAAIRADGALAIKLVEAAFAQKKAPELKFDTVYFLALLADKHRKHEEAERFYRQCLNDKNLTPTNEAVIYVGLLQTLSSARKYDAMVETCQEALKKAKGINPRHLYQELARAQAGLKRYDDALQTLDRAGKEAGDDERYSLARLRVSILSMAHRYTDAETECLALLKKHDRPADAVMLRYILSNIYSASKQQPKAEEQLLLILKIDPDNAPANNDLGYNWADQGKNLEVAEQMIRKAMEVERSQRRRNPNLSAEDDKDNAAYVDSLGWVLFRRGQIDEARKELERAITLGDGDDPVIHDHLGDVYNRLKMHVEAGRSWQRALELYEKGVRGNEEERVRDLRRKIDQVRVAGGGKE